MAEGVKDGSMGNAPEGIPESSHATDSFFIATSMTHQGFKYIGVFITSLGRPSTFLFRRQNSCVNRPPRQPLGNDTHE